ncbi:MAG TPA: metalloregulator ArsR/SmtB family transcription factor [Treponemataceae bacterium]|nr:metalloregulator ArsR/SmtB family transcription factor [Treponemataceae bacterium]
MNAKQLAEAYKALSNDKRLEIFLQILRSERKSFPEPCDCFVSEIIGKIGVGAPTVSHHLKELAGAGLIETEKNGKFLVARVNRRVLTEIRDALDIGANAQKGGTR